MPISRSARCSPLRSEPRSSQTTTSEANTSTEESRPNAPRPSDLTLRPAAIATIPSRVFQPIVTYSSWNARRRSRRWRGGSVADGTISGECIGRRTAQALDRTIKSRHARRTFGEEGLPRFEDLPQADDGGRRAVDAELDGDPSRPWPRSEEDT